MRQVRCSAMLGGTPFESVRVGLSKQIIELASERAAMTEQPWCCTWGIETIALAISYLCRNGLCCPRRSSLSRPERFQ